ncbi:MAG: hypothetical protein KDA62_16385 [Planctomycetales bacterium]|nr:hypothetical protein [Planctomycetales bacterium]
MSDDRRTSFRCPVGDEFAQAVLCYGSSKLPVHLLEQSAGGFGIQASRPLPLRENQRVLLKTSQGVFETFVVHNTSTESGSRIGLRRVSELSGKSATTGKVEAKPTSRFPVGVLALCGAFFISGIAVPMLMDPTEGLGFSKPKQQTPKAVKLTKSVMLLHDLKSSRFMKDLKLEPEQQTRIHGVVDDAVFNLTAVFQNREKMTEEERAEVGFQLISTAWREIQTTLTDEQRARWSDMVTQPSPTAK